MTTASGGRAMSGTVKKSRMKETVCLRVMPDGSLRAADLMSSQRLRAKGFRANDVVFGELKKARNEKFHRLVHGFGALCADNIDAFAGKNAHECLKLIQMDADIGCERVEITCPNGEKEVWRWPKSLSYVEMDESEFQEIYRAMCNYIAETYWPELDADQIAAMAEMMGQAA